MRWQVLVKGFPGHPLHPPMTDATIGALTVGTIATVLGWFEVVADVLAPTAVAALVIGLVFAVPTIVTGFADFLDLSRAAPANTVALVHMSLMVVAVAGFFLTVLLLFPTLDGAAVSTAAAVVAAASFAVLTAGGWVGGSLSFVYGVRVLGASDTPPSQAVRPSSSKR